MTNCSLRLRANFTQTLCKLYANFTQTLCKLYANFVQTTLKLLTNYPSFLMDHLLEHLFLQRRIKKEVLGWSNLDTRSTISWSIDPAISIGCWTALACNYRADHFNMFLHYNMLCIEPSCISLYFPCKSSLIQQHSTFELAFNTIHIRISNIQTKYCGKCISPRLHIFDTPCSNR